MANGLKGSLAITGNVGKTDLKSFGNDKSVLNVSIAVTESRKVNNDWVEETDWFNCTLWNPSESKKSNLVKGALVTAILKPKSSKKDNVTYWNWNIEKIHIANSHSATPSYDNSKDEVDDDAPF